MTNGASTDSSKADSAVELKKNKDGVYEPVGQPQRQRRRLVLVKQRWGTPSEQVESDVITGFRYGMKMIRKIGKIFDVRL